MIYLGSKARIAKELLEIMLKDRKPNQFFVDCFCGGGNLVQSVDGNVIASDLNNYTIDFLNKIKEDTSWIPKDNSEFGRTNYHEIKNNKENYPCYLLGHVGHNLSFGGRLFEGWVSNKRNDDFVKQAYNNAVNQSEKIKHIEFVCCSYDELEILDNSIIYCDIPYKNTKKYKHSKNFDYDKFYAWCLEKKQEGHEIFVSEYQMPKPFRCVWEKKIKMYLDVNSNNNERVEKLFML